MAAMNTQRVSHIGRSRSRRNTVAVNALFKSKTSTTTVVREKPKAKPSKQVEKAEKKQGGLGSFVQALDFANPTREDRDIIDNAKINWKKGESKLTPEEYAALARRIRGSYKDYFKDYVVEERVENTYWKPDSSSGTVPYLPLLVGVVVALLGTTAFVVAQTSGL